MKRLLTIFITCILMISSALCVTGCGELDRDSELAEIYQANLDNIKDSFEQETCRFDLFSDYMKSWAKGSGLDFAFDGKHSLVITNDASKGCENDYSTSLLCNFDTSDVQGCLNMVATGSTCLLGPVNHGPLTLIITEENEGRFVGIDEVPDKYLDCDHLINLQAGSSDTIYTSGARNATCTFSKSGDATETNYDNAFEITLDMPEYTDTYNFSKDDSYPNPINTLGNFLATLKSSGKLFDIASFTSASKEGYTPYSATAVIVVDDNSVESVKSRFESSYENIEEKFEALEDTFVYTMTETDVPENVLDSDISYNLASLMYTLNTGACLQDEDTGLIYAASYIKSIDTSKGDLSMVLDIRSRGESYLDSISAEYKTTSGLCSTKYQCDKNGFLWTSKSDSQMAEYLTSRVPLLEGDSAISIKTYENDMISKRLPDLDMVIYASDKDNRKSAIENITHFMDPDVDKDISR